MSSRGVLEQSLNSLTEVETRWKRKPSEAERHHGASLAKEEEALAWQQVNQFGARPQPQSEENLWSKR